MDFPLLDGVYLLDRGDRWRNYLDLDEYRTSPPRKGGAKGLVQMIGEIAAILIAGGMGLLLVAAAWIDDFRRREAEKERVRRYFEEYRKRKIDKLRHDAES